MTEVNKPIVQGREKSVGTVEKNNQIHKVARKSFWWSNCWPSLVPFALSKLKAKLFILASHYGSHYSILKADFEWMNDSIINMLQSTGKAGDFFYLRNSMHVS